MSLTASQHHRRPAPPAPRQAAASRGHIHPPSPCGPDSGLDLEPACRPCSQTTHGCAINNMARAFRCDCELFKGWLIAKRCSCGPVCPRWRELICMCPKYLQRTTHTGADLTLALGAKAWLAMSMPGTMRWPPAPSLKLRLCAQDHAQRHASRLWPPADPCRNMKQSSHQHRHELPGCQPPARQECCTRQHCQSAAMMPADAAK